MGVLREAVTCRGHPRTPRGGGHTLPPTDKRPNAAITRHPSFEGRATSKCNQRASRVAFFRARAKVGEGAGAQARWKAMAA
eukprot:9500305-Pyramimonas_sp.AAC.1